MKSYLVFLILILVFFLSSCSSVSDVEAESHNLPDGYGLDNYAVVEKLDVVCESHSECITPPGYMVLSNCPYTSLCLDNYCVVICPSYS